MIKTSKVVQGVIAGFIIDQGWRAPGSGLS